MARGRPRKREGGDGKGNVKGNSSGANLGFEAKLWAAAASTPLPTGEIITAIDHAEIVAEEERTYVVFALDTSGSMKEYYSTDQNGGADMVSGWSGFHNLIVTIVGWDHDSEVVFGPVPLKGNETVLAEILDRLSELCLETDLTYYDQGISGSMAALRDHAADDVRSPKLIVFLAGFSEFRPGELLEDYVSEANRSGYTIFTIGIGINESSEASKMQYTSLRRISDGAGGKFYNVTAFMPEELNAVMDDIVREIDILRVAPPYP